MDVEKTSDKNQCHSGQRYIVGNFLNLTRVEGRCKMPSANVTLCWGNGDQEQGCPSPTPITTFLIYITPEVSIK